MEPITADDAALVARCRRDRDRAAFDTLVGRHRQRVIGVAFAHCRDVALAEDIAQEAFLVAWSGLGSLRDGDHVGRWLCGIARNLATSAARTRDRRARVVFVAPELAAEIASAASDPESELVQREDRALFERALADVEPAHRDILVRYYLDGQSLAQIARAAGIGEAVAKKRLSRAREAVRHAVATRADRAMARLRRPMMFSPFGKAVLVMASKKLIVVGTVVLLAAAGGAVWWLRKPADATTTPPASGASGATPAGTTAAAAAAAIDARPPPADLHVGKLDRPARDVLLAQIRAAHARANTTSATTATPPPALPSGADDPIDKEYIRGAVHEIIPMLAECYDEGLQRNPKLAAANVVVEFTIEGEHDVGGVVGTSKIDDTKTDLADATVRECIQETMYALKIDPPPGGNTVTVRYPFAFSPAGEEPPAPTH